MTQKLYSFQHAPLLRYLQFDDGYEHCISGPSSHPEEAELKKLKFLNLQKIANHRHRWVLDLPARNPRALPGEQLLNPPQYRRKQIFEEFDISAFQETCRFIAMIYTDYDGTAMDVLQDNLETGDFFAPEGNDSLEFRALMCIARWIGTHSLMLGMKNGDVTKVVELVRRSNVIAYGSRNWTAHHVRLGEMQALQAIQGLVLAQIEEKWSDKKYDLPEEFTLRDNA
jgi:hypothetical protein